MPKPGGWKSSGKEARLCNKTRVGSTVASPRWRGIRDSGVVAVKIIRSAGTLAPPTSRQMGGFGACRTSAAVAESTLIVKIAAVGDMVMALPMVSARRERSPAGHIAWLCETTVAPLLHCVEGIDEWVTKLGGHRFDRILIAHSDPRYRFLARTRARSRASASQNAASVRCAEVSAHARRRIRPPDHSRRRSSHAPLCCAAGTGGAFACACRTCRPRTLSTARDDPLRRWPLDRYVGLAAMLDSEGYRSC